MQDKIKTKFPNISITCTNEKASLSGVVIVFVLTDAGRDIAYYYVLSHIFVNIMVACCIMMTVWHDRRAP